MHGQTSAALHQLSSEPRKRAQTSHLDDLNTAQRAAATFGIPHSGPCTPTPPLLVIAGAGTGKTKTLAYRVAQQILRGAHPGRILLLTFGRRMAAEMTRRVDQICTQALKGRASLPARSIEWSGTFHAIGAALLRLHARSIGLDPAFSILDRGDSADLMDIVRDELGYSRTKSRFPKKATCLAIYSFVVNNQMTLLDALLQTFPWCAEWEQELNRLFSAYVQTKQTQAVLDYDDLLLYWARMMEIPEIARLVASRFDHVLVDEYQDTNALQASILLGLKPDGAGVTVVGDDAQSIYAFRAARVKNILEFPAHFNPPAAVITLEQNYRSSQPILEGCNRVISHAAERYSKNLYSKRAGGSRPSLAMVTDETAQVDYVIERVLTNREAGMELRDQAVLFRASHHSGPLEVELTRRNIPFVKFGGLKFLEAAHVKDVLAVLRWAENPRDRVAGFRVLQLMPGVGPAIARRALTALEQRSYAGDALARIEPPASAAAAWSGLASLMQDLAASREWRTEMDRLRRWYDPILELRYEAARMRAGDLDQLGHMAAGHATRVAFLTDLALDPPAATGTEAGPPLKDEDWLVLTTIHSAKGQEWRAVYVLNVVDGCIPSDLATGTAEEIEEERRLLYVAMTRARDDLVLMQPSRFYVRGQTAGGDRHVYAPRSRFITDEDLAAFETIGVAPPRSTAADDALEPLPAAIDLKEAMRRMWGQSG
jgi:DNA helicase-2/ATP-dependent DNA helicase PcrA